MQAHSDGRITEHSNDRGWETFEIIVVEDFTVAFKTYHGTYIKVITH